MSLQYAWPGIFGEIGTGAGVGVVEGHISIIATESNAERAKSIDMAVPISRQQNQPGMLNKLQHMLAKLLLLEMAKKSRLNTKC